MWHVCIQLLPKTVPPVRLFSENKKSPPCRLTERGAIPYNKGRGTPRLAVWARLKNYICYETVTGLGWRFHRFRLMRIVTVQPRICNVMVIGIISPPLRECSPNRPPLVFVYFWSPGLRERCYCTINLGTCLQMSMQKTKNPRPAA